MVNILRSAIIGLLISLSSSYTLMTLNILAIPNATVTGQELLKQVIIAAILGIIIGLISLIFKADRLPFTLQLLIHFVLVTMFVLIAGYFGKWYDVANIATIIYIFISIIVIYLISWGIILLLIKRDIKEINDFIQKKKG